MKYLNLYICGICFFLNVPELITSDIKSRSKRYLFFPPAGAFKIIIAVATSVRITSKQTMGIGWNFQFQYPLPGNTSVVETYPPIISRKHRDIVQSDRALFYTSMENLFESHGLNGKLCMLHTICENAVSTLYHEDNGLYGHLLHVALTPDYGDGQIDIDLDPVYLDAQKAGQFGADCSSLYPECQETGLLNKISLLLDTPMSLK